MTYDAAELAQTLFEEIDDAAFVIDTESLRLLDVNPVAELFTGMRRAELLALDITQILEPTATAKYANFTRVLHSNSRFHSEEGYRLRHGNGAWRPVNVTLTRLDTQTIPVSLLLVRDISARVKIEQELRKSNAVLEERVRQRTQELARLNETLRTQIAELRRVEEEQQHTLRLLEAIAEGTADAMFVKDRQGRYLLFNAAAARFVGKPVAEVLGRDDTALFDVASARLVMERDRQTMEAGELETKEERLTASGVTRVYQATKWPYRDAKGEVIGIIGVSRDITEQKLATEGLTLFRALVDQAHDALEVVDPDTGRVLDVNEYACRIHGYTREEYLSLTIAEIDPTVADLGGWEAIARRLREAGTFAHEGRHRRKDGTYFPVEIHATYTRLHRDYIVAVVRDVSERQFVEAALRKERELIRLILDTDPNLIFVLDAKGRVVIANKALANYYGTTPDAIVANGGVFNGALPTEMADYARVDAEVLRTGCTIARDEMNTRPDGQTRWLHTIKTPLRLPDGTVHVLGISSDITDGKRAENELARTQQRLQHVISTNPAVLFTLKVEREAVSPDWVSENIQAMLGYTAAECLYSSWWMDRVHPDDLPQAQREMQTSLLSAGHLANEFRFRHKNGDYRWIRNEVRLLRDRLGQPNEIVGSWSDITEHKHLEEQFRQSHKMEAIGRLAGGVAHDFNNLLTVIKGYSDFIAVQPEVTTSVRDMVHEIINAGDRATGLTRQLLSFSRRAVIEPQVLDVKSVLHDTDRLLRRIIGEDIEMTVQMAPEPCLVLVDRNQLEQVVLNLAVNARDAMPQGGKLALAVRHVLLGDEYVQQHPDANRGAHVVLSVGDTGCGMSPETLAQIWEPFFTTKGEHGTGIGLATVYGIVKQSGGHVAVASEVNGGTIFEIYLPAQGKVYKEVKSSQKANHMQTGSETILLVEDEAGVRALARKILHDCGYTVLESRDGIEALQLVENYQRPIHLLLTDVVMPRMGGRALATRLTALLPTLKVLYVSGYTDDAVMRHGVMSAKVSFLQKPFSPLALAEKVRAVLDAQ